MCFYVDLCLFKKARVLAGSHKQGAALKKGGFSLLRCGAALSAPLNPVLTLIVEFELIVPCDLTPVSHGCQRFLSKIAASPVKGREKTKHKAS